MREHSVVSCTIANNRAGEWFLKFLVRYEG